jgi:hypothetical protein
MLVNLPTENIRRCAMENNICYISSKQQLVDTVSAMLKDSQKHDIMISGVWNRSLHENIIQMIIEENCCSSCKVIIPKLVFKGDISLSLLRNVCKAEGQVKINNSVTNNLLLIDSYAFILSFSSRLNSLNILNTTFECAVLIKDEMSVGTIRAQLSDAFNNSIPFRM